MLFGPKFFEVQFLGDFAYFCFDIFGCKLRGKDLRRPQLSLIIEFILSLIIEGSIDPKLSEEFFSIV